MNEVIKVGGNELDEPYFLAGFALEIQAMQARLGRPVVIVHGGGKAIAGLQQRLGILPKKIEGLRVTDAESLVIAEMVLSGYSNKLIVKALSAANMDAIGLSGVDGGLLEARQKQHPRGDLGLVGEIINVRVSPLQMLLAAGITPVISPISGSPENTTYNVNADEAAAAISQALGAHTLHLVSNVPGVLQEGQVIPALTITQTETLIKQGVITDGMVPKVSAALSAVAKGVPQARIVNLAGLSGAGGTIFHRGEEKI